MDVCMRNSVYRCEGKWMYVCVTVCTSVGEMGVCMYDGMYRCAGI